MTKKLTEAEKLARARAREKAKADATVGNQSITLEDMNEPAPEREVHGYAMEASSLVWGDPPAARKGKRTSHYEEIAKELRAHPNQWAVIADGVSQSNVTRFNGGTTAFPLGEFEFKGRQIEGSRKVRVYARSLA